MQANLYHLSIPMRQAFNHATAERKEAETIILQLVHKGIVGLGECVPRKYVTGETINSVINTLTQINLVEVSRQINFSSIFAALASLKKLQVFTTRAKLCSLNVMCILEMALLDIIGKYFHLSITDIIKNYLLPYELRSFIETDKFPTSQVMDFSLATQEFLKQRAPFHYVKVKVGKNLTDNVRRIQQIRNVLGKKVKISVDANMVWNLAEAIRMVKALKPYTIDYYEELLPKGSYASYHQLKCATGIKILLDESLCSFNDATQAITHAACDAFNIRISKCGGILRSIDLIKLASRNNLAFQIGAQVAEVGPLIAAGRQLIGAIKQNSYITYEAGQPDRFFAGNYLIKPMPLVERTTNLAEPLTGYGLGITLNSNFSNYVKLAAFWKGKQWQIG